MFRLITGVVLGSLLLAGVPVLAQERGSWATVAGLITDTTGAALPGAVIDAVVGERAVATATSGADGRYELSVPPGVPLSLRVRLAGFGEQAIALLGATGSVTRDVTLQVGGLSDTLVVTASRTAESRASVTASTSVVTAADIEALGSTSLADVMRTMPGLAVEASGREGAQTSLFARGGESDYNLVLIDGVRVNQSGGSFDFSRIAAGEIERVEVVRGAQSSLWGSDAMGAVVQVFTRRAGATDAPRLSGSVEGGTFNTWRGNAELTGGARQRIDYAASLSHRRTDGAFSDILPEDDRFEQSAFHGSVGAALGARAAIRSTLRYSNAQGRAIGNIAYGVRDRGTEYDSKDLSWSLSVPHTAGRRYAGTATVNYFRYDSVSADNIGDPTTNVYAVLTGNPRALFPETPRLVRLIGASEFQSLSADPGGLRGGEFLAFTQFGVSDFPFSSATEFRRPSVRYQGDYTWASGQRLSAGYEWERESNPLVNTFSLDNNAVFVQQQFSVADRWFVTAGGRVDSKEGYDTFFSPKLSAGGFLMPFRAGAVSSLKVFGNIGRGIKSPTFAERFGGSFADPSPDLQVERARTADVGVEATFADQRFRGSVAYFDNDYRDQIAYRSGTIGDGIPEFINIEGSQARGWELEGVVQRPIAGVTVGGTYSFVDSEVVTSISVNQQFLPGQPLLRRPKHSGTLRASYEIGLATVNVNARFVGQRHDNSFLSLRTVPGPALPVPVTTDITVNPGYTVAGLGVDLRASESLTIFLRGDNVADTSYESALGFPGLPRTVMAGARFNLGR